MASTNTEANLAPIFIKRDDGKSFKEMKSIEISHIIQELESNLGQFEKGGVTIASGGDLFIRPTTEDQQQKLLHVNFVLNGKIIVTCSLPKSASGSRVTIHQVPTGDTEEEIFLALQDRGYQIKSVYRFKTPSGSSKIPSPTVALEFTGCAPSEIAFHGMKFTPRPYIPGPPRCSKRCQRLGHTSNHCKEEEKCNNCGTAHDDMANCTAPPRCINCEGKHPASSTSCPKFQKMKMASRTPTNEQGKSMSSHSSSRLTYSQALSESMHSTSPTIAILEEKITAMQQNLAGITSKLSKVQELEIKVTTLDSTVAKIQSSFSKLEAGQEASNTKIDKLCLLLTKLLPDLEVEKMDTSQPEGDAQNSQKSSSGQQKNSSTRIPIRSESSDPASKKLRSGPGIQQTR
jgi:hypothetical protein